MKYHLKNLLIILACDIDTTAEVVPATITEGLRQKLSPTEWIEFEPLPAKSVKPLPECICEGSEWIDSPFRSKKEFEEEKACIQDRPI